MALDVRIISGAGAGTYYLVNSTGAPVAGGSATSASTTPYSINAAEWTQTAATRRTIYSGGPPFGVGSRPVYTGFDNVTETVEIGIVGSSADNMISLLQTLRRVLNTALLSNPAILYWQPAGATSPTYYYIYSADVQEVGDWQNPAAGFVNVLCRVTWTRSALGARASTAETILNAASYQSRFTGTPDCFEATSAGSGDLIYDGQPLNISVGSASADLKNFLIGSILSVTAISNTMTVTTSSTTGTQSTGTPAQISLTNQNTYYGAKTRLLAQTSAATTGSQMRLRVYLLTPATAAIYGAQSALLYTSPWFTSSNAVQLVDCGTVPTSFAYYNTSSFLYAILEVRSPGGTSVTVTLSNVYQIDYSTLMRTDENTLLVASGSHSLTIDMFKENAVHVPVQTPIVRTTTGGLELTRAPVIGTPPQYFLYSAAVPVKILVIPFVSFAPDNSVAYASTYTYTVTAKHAPQYYTLRGNG